MEALLPFSAHKSMSQKPNQRVFDPGDPLCGPQDDPHITWPIKVVYLRPHTTSDRDKRSITFLRPQGIYPTETHNIKGQSRSDFNVFLSITYRSVCFEVLWKEILQDQQIYAEQRKAGITAKSPYVFDNMFAPV